MTNTLTENVIAAIAKVKDIPTSDISIDSNLEELAVDSLDAIEVLFEVEEQYEIDVPADRMNDLKTVRDVVEGVQALLDQKAAGSDDAGANQAGAQA